MSRVKGLLQPRRKIIHVFSADPILLLLLLVVGCATAPAARVRRMSLDEKVGQLFVSAAHGVFMNQESPEYRRLVHQVQHNRVGGIIWFSSNVYETALLIRHLQKIAAVPLLVSSDLEAGSGMRFEDTTYWPWQMAVAAAGDPALAERQGHIVAAEAREIGINQIFAPVADVNVNPDNPVINVRSYGEDPETVARFVAAFVRGVESGGVIATAKHFPGHGDTETDSHRSLPVLNVSRERLDAVELVPFRAAIEAGARSVMVAHVALPALDAAPAPVRAEDALADPYSGAVEVARGATVPASLSPAVVDGLLRREMGFDGLVVTDALDMGGITDHYDAGEAAVRAILAGADQVLKSPDTDAAIAAVRRAVETGRISEERLDVSVRRILHAKARVRLPPPDPERIFRLVDSKAHRALAEEIARRSVTLLREEEGVLPLAHTARILHVAVSNFLETRAPGAEFRQAMAARAPARVEGDFLIDSRTRPEDLEALPAAAAAADTIVVSFFIRPRSEEGRIRVPDAAHAALGALAAAGRPVVAVSFGSPYVLRELPELATYLVAYGGQSVMQSAAAAALFGETPITGRLPVTIPGAAARGDGIQKPVATERAP